MAQDAAALRETLSLAPVIPVMILDDVALARPLAEALVAGGLRVLEVTLRTPNALRVIAEMSKVPGAVVGSGTIRSPLQMQQSVDAGCRFMVAPGSPPRLIEAAEDYDVPLLPAVGTPTEAMTMAENGYSFLKFFPAEAMGGAAVLAAFASPLPDLFFCPTGGINAKNAQSYLSLSNVICVGGTWTMPKDAILARDWTRITALAREAAALPRAFGKPPVDPG